MHSWAASLHATDFKLKPTSEWSTSTNVGSSVHHSRFASDVLLDLGGHFCFPGIAVSLRDLLLKLDNHQCWVQALWTAIGAVHDAMATVQLHGVIELCEPFLGE